MPAALIPKQEVLDRLVNVFREKGYDGASLSEISSAAGLGKSSLYHYFPGGKEDMARQALAHLDEALAQALFEPLRSARAPAKKLDAMLDTIDAFYAGGKQACLLGRLSASVEHTRFQKPLTRVFTVWLDAVEALCAEAGLARPVARARAEDFVVRIEGALVLCAGTGNTRVFGRTLKDLRRTLLAPP